MNLRFRFQQVITLTESAAGVGESYVFRVNSLYDVNLTGVGAQPVGYDQWSALFARSRVYGGKFSIQAVTANTNPAVIGMFQLNGGSSMPSADAWQAQKTSKWKLVSGKGGLDAFQAARAYKVAPMLGVTEQAIMTEEDYSESYLGPAVSGPNQALFAIFVRGIAGVASASFVVIVDLFAKMEQPLALSSS